MNITDLCSELDRQAVDLPEPEAIRADADRRLAAHARRRRQRAVVAAAAAVAREFCDSCRFISREPKKGSRS